VLGPQPDAALYKTLGLVGWAGRFLLKDVSGPASSSVPALAGTPYSFCFALAGGECLAGAKPGETFVNVPYTVETAYCTTGLSWANLPCVMPAYPGIGGIRQHSATGADPQGTTDRVISHGLLAPGEAYAFYSAGASPTGNRILVNGSGFIDGVRAVALTIGALPWEPDKVVRNRFVPLPIKVAPGLGAYAEVRFGYGYPGIGTPSQLFCTPRQEYCATAANESKSVPYVFAGEPHTPRNCSSGCTIEVPALAGQVIYVQTYTSNNGKDWKPQGEIIPLAAP